MELLVFRVLLELILLQMELAKSQILSAKHLTNQMGIVLLAMTHLISFLEIALKISTNL
jgi:hypothetical protein